MEESKDVFYCDYCKYSTIYACNFKLHLTTVKHNENIENKENVVINMEKIKIHCCDHCNKFYRSKQSLQNHKLKHEKEILNKKFNDQIIEENKKLTKIVNDSLKIADTSMSILKYAKLHLKDAEPLEKLKDEDLSKVIGYKNPKNNESKNESYVKTAIHKYNHHIFYSFIGDMIVEYYKPKAKNSTNLIATDTSRLCFIIMQKITKGKNEKKEWINDKSGKKFTELVLTPVIDAVKHTLVEFVEFKKTKELSESNLCLMAKCIELKRDIEVNKFTNQILKYVAPYFHFDNLKLLGDTYDTDDTIITDNSEEYFENKSQVKVIAKKNK